MNAAHLQALKKPFFIAMNVAQLQALNCKPFCIAMRKCTSMNPRCSIPQSVRDQPVSLSSIESDLKKLRAGLNRATKLYGLYEVNALENAPYLVAAGVSLAAYEVFCMQIEPVWKLAFIPKNGTGFVLLFGDPSPVHECITKYMDSLIYEQVSRAGLDMRQLVRLLGSSTQMLWGGTKKQPDVSFTSKSSLSQQPRFSMEVAYHNESLPRLIDEVRHWHASGTQLAIGIKIHVTQAKSETDRRIGINLYWVEQFKDDLEPRIVEFSPDMCCEQNQQDFMVSFPFSCVTEDIESHADFFIHINLYKLQQCIIDELMFEAVNNQAVFFVDKDGRYHMEKHALCVVCKQGFEGQETVQCLNSMCKAWCHTNCVNKQIFEGQGWSQTGCSKVQDGVWLCPLCTTITDASPFIADVALDAKKNDGLV